MGGPRLPVFTSLCVCVCVCVCYSQFTNMRLLRICFFFFCAGPWWSRWRLGPHWWPALRSRFPAGRRLFYQYWPLHADPIRLRLLNSRGRISSILCHQWSVFIGYYQSFVSLGHRVIYYYIEPEQLCVWSGNVTPSKVIWPHLQINS